MGDKHQIWQEMENPFFACEQQDLVETELGSKMRRQSETNRKVNELMHGVTDAFCTLDSEWRFKYLNGQCECYYGRSSEELLGKILWDECPDMRGSDFEMQCRHAMCERTAVHFEVFSTVSLRWFEIHAFPTVEGLAVEGLAIYVCDISSRKSAEAKREQLLHEAQESSRHKDEFLTTLSHELRAPLSAVAGWTILLRSGNLDEAERARALETIERSAWAQTQIIEDILDIARMAKGKMRLQTQTISLVDVLQATIDAALPSAEAKAVRLSLEVRTTELVSGDPHRLQQVFWNLLSNAVKFTPRGGEVRVALLRSDDEVLATVTDTGQGITPEFLPFIFERFRQADKTSTRARSGLGLGLSIVRQLVDLHDGWVWADSAGQGQGATFTVGLPRAVAAETQRKNPPRESSALADPADAGFGLDSVAAAGARQTASLVGARVLVVEDEADARDLVTKLLQEQGAHVVTAPSAAEALIAFARVHPEVLVSDIGMPEGDGYQLIAGVRALEAARGDAPALAVALTGHARAEDRERALAAGFQHHLAKPFAPAELLRVMATSTTLLKTGSGEGR